MFPALAPVVTVKAEEDDSLRKVENRADHHDAEKVVGALDVALLWHVWMLVRCLVTVRKVPFECETDKGEGSKVDGALGRKNQEGKQTDPWETVRRRVHVGVCENDTSVRRHGRSSDVRCATRLATRQVRLSTRRHQKKTDAVSHAKHAHSQLPSYTVVF